MRWTGVGDVEKYCPKSLWNLAKKPFGSCKSSEAATRHGNAVTCGNRSDPLAPVHPAFQVARLPCPGMARIDSATGAVPAGIEARPRGTAQPGRRPRRRRRVHGRAGHDDNLLRRRERLRKLNAVYAQHMQNPPPARSAPANVRLPRGLLVPIEAIAVLPNRKRHRPNRKRHRRRQSAGVRHGVAT
jgi:2-iminobutanoate/2-iminopropanoate deaminase